MAAQREMLRNLGVPEDRIYQAAKLSAAQQRHLVKLHREGKHNNIELAPVPRQNPGQTVRFKAIVRPNK